MDIHLNEILDADIFTMQPTKHRRLQATIPKRVNKYLEVLKKKWENQSINNRFDKILTMMKAKQISTLEHELNKLDKSISEILRHAEKKCCSLPTTNLLH